VSVERLATDTITLVTPTGMVNLKIWFQINKQPRATQSKNHLVNINATETINSGTLYCSNMF